jgi:gluconolactonase
MGEEKIKTFTPPEVIADDIGFGESPLWHKDGFLIFSDVKKNRIMKLKNGRVEIFLEESGWKGAPTEDQSDQPGANGLAYDQDGNIIFCQHGNHAIAKLNKDGSIETIVNSYQGRRLNSPNDLCIGPDGSIYFSDPPYGLKEKKIQPSIAQSQSGVYRWYNNNLELINSEFNYPNGLCFSPDYRYLYIGSNEQDERRIIRYEVKDGKLQNKICFAEENADGIKTDGQGNLYLATLSGVKVLSKSGEQIGFIEIPEMTTNLCIHDDQIYITTAGKLYLSYFL